MQAIKKGTEPPLLAMVRALVPSDPGAGYRRLTSDQRNVLRQNLCKEQHFLCAFCLRRVEPVDEKLKIAHFLPQSVFLELEKLKSQEPDKTTPQIPKGPVPERLRNHGSPLDWTNMLGACKGNEGSPRREQTCDTRQANEPLDILLHPVLNDRIESLFVFSATGEVQIQHPDSAVRERLQTVIGRSRKNSQGTLGNEPDDGGALNLNEGKLKRNRKAAVDQLIAMLPPGRGGWVRSDIEKVLKRWQNPAGGKLPEYAPVAVQYLQRKLKQLER